MFAVLSATLMHFPFPFRYIFWTDWFRPAKIMRAWSDGSHASPIVNTTLGWPNGLAIDWRFEKNNQISLFLRRCSIPVHYK